VDKIKGVPTIRVEPKAEVLGLLCQRLEDGVIPHATEPIGRIRRVGFAAVHDAVPVATGGGLNALADGVGLIEEIVIKPHAGQASGCHVAVTDPGAAEGVLDAEDRELRAAAGVRSARTQRHQAVCLKKTGKRRTIALWIKWRHGLLPCDAELLEVNDANTTG